MEGEKKGVDVGESCGYPTETWDKGIEGFKA